MNGASGSPLTHPVTETAKSISDRVARQSDCAVVMTYANPRSKQSFKAEDIPQHISQGTGVSIGDGKDIAGGSYQSTKVLLRLMWAHSLERLLYVRLKHYTPEHGEVLQLAF
jgi:hypothetical protein